MIRLALSCGEHRVDWLTMEGGELPGSGRSLEIFLDEVARTACRDASWLLDDRFKGAAHAW